MISILIPIYNCDARVLVKELVHQAELLGIEFEIICLDNRSIFFRDKNIQIKSYLNCTYEVLNENIGQWALRNRLAKKAKYDFLLFLDSDLKIDYHHFLRNYIQEIPASELVCGGIHYLPWPPTTEYLLHWQYGTKREVKKSNRKNHFFTCNFLIHKSLFDKIKFNENLIQYGHENALFGISLNQLNIKRKNVFCPVSHNQLDSCDTYLEKTRISASEVAKNIINNHVSFSDAKGYRYIRIFLILKKTRTSKIANRLFHRFINSLELNLRGDHPILLFLDIYKIGFLCHYDYKNTAQLH